MKNTNVFRDLYDKYAIFPLPDSKRSVFSQYDGSEEADHLLVYGTISEERLYLVILALVKKKEDGYHFYKAKNEQVAVLDASALWDLPYVTDPEIPDISYTSLPEEIRSSTSEHAATFFELDLIDDLRDPVYPGIVKVCLETFDCEPEICRVRWTDMLSNQLNLGILVDEPKQDMWIHAGDEVSFYVESDQYGNIRCISQLDTVSGEPEGDLTDGSMLKDAIETYKAFQNKEHFLIAAHVLADSIVWVPCYVDEEKYSKEQIETALKNDDFNMYKIKQPYFDIFGVPFERVDHAMGKDRIVQIYLTKEEADEYGGGNISIQKSAVEVLLTAIHDEDEYWGLMVNPGLSEEFFLERDFWPALLQMSDLYDVEKQQ